MDTATPPDLTRDDAATEPGGWQLDEHAARAYEAHLVPAIFDRLADRLVAVAGIDRGHRVLDVACGTGIVARKAARLVGDTGRVVGVDVNDAMLATARTASRDAGITWRIGDATSLPVDDDAFDVVTCQQALQFLPDQVAALREMRRAAVPGGRVVVGVLRGLAANPVYEVFRAALDTHAGPEAGAMIASPFAGGSREDLRAVAEAAGLDHVVVQVAVAEERFPSIVDFVAHEAASSPLRVALSRLDRARHEALVADLQERLADHLDDLGLVFHNETHLVVGNA